MAEANIATGGWCTRRRPDRLAGATVAAVGVATAGRQQEIGFAILAVQRVERQVSGASTPARRTLQQPAGGKTVAGGEVVGGPGEGAVGIALRELPPHLFKERNRSSLVGSPDVAFTDQVDDWRGRAGAVASLPRTAAPRGARQIAAAGAESDQDDGGQSSASALERHGHGRRRPLELQQCLQRGSCWRVPPPCAAPLRQSLLQICDAPSALRPWPDVRQSPRGHDSGDSPCRCEAARLGR